MVFACSAYSTCWWHVLCSHLGKSMGAHGHGICAVVCWDLGNLSHRIVAVVEHANNFSSVRCHRAIAVHHYMLTSELNRTLKPLVQAILSNYLHLRCRRTLARYRFSSYLLSAKSGHWWFVLFSWISLYFDHFRSFDRSIFSWGNSHGSYKTFYFSFSCNVLCYELHELVTEQFALQEHISIWFFQKPQLFYCVVRLSRVLDLLANSTAKEIIYVLCNWMQAHV